MDPFSFPNAVATWVSAEWLSEDSKMGQDHENHQVAATPASQLPAPAVVNILERVGLQERLLQCSLVCRTWSAAAVSATPSIVAELPAGKLPALRHWLKRNGKHVHTLHLTCSRHAFSQVAEQPREAQLMLPCAELVHLTSLHVDGFIPNLQLPPPGNKDSSSPAEHTNTSNNSASNSTRRRRRKNNRRTNDAPAGTSSSNSNSNSSSNSSSHAAGLLPLPMLRDLAVHGCRMSSTSTLMQLTHLSGVTSLSLADLEVSNDDTRDSAATMSRAVSTLLQQLPKLACLKVAGVELAPHTLSGVSSSLTYLSMACTSCHGHRHWDNNTVDQPPCLPKQLPQAGQLQVLQLIDVGFDLRVLADMPQLQEMVLQDCLLLPDIPDEGELDPELALLEAVGSLKQLRRLELDKPICGALEDLEPEDFTSLTASSQLSCLSLLIQESLPWPLGATQHIFPAGKQLQHLQELHIMSDTVADEEEDMHWCLEAADLLRVVHACPALTTLSLVNVTAPGAVYPLLQLPPSIKVLKVSGIAFDDAAAAVVARLTQLTELTWAQCPNLTDMGLEQLTALTGLHSLELRGDLGLSNHVADKDPELGLYCDLVLRLLSSQEGMECPDVWQQLREVCGLNPDIARRRLKSTWNDTQSMLKQVTDTQSRLEQTLAELSSEVKQLLGEGNRMAVMFEL